MTIIDGGPLLPRFFMVQQPVYGPHNPHPLSQMRTELVWEGKSDVGFTYSETGKYTACVKVVDTFGCDISITVEVEV